MTQDGKHTPGPWRADGNIVRIADGYREFQMVADCSMLVAGEENARLIAAAPDLLAALRSAQIALAGAYGSGLTSEVHPALAEVRAAIARATQDRP